MAVERPNSKILLDGGDPEETIQVKKALGFLDGQTTNPTYIAKNPGIVKRIAGGRGLSPEEQLLEYKKIVQQISPLVGDAGVSIEVFADFDTTADEMFAQGEEMFSWIPNAYVKYPCLPEGLRAAERSVKKGMRVNMTLCFTQEQAAAVYAATKGSRAPVYVSPFVGRLDDSGENGLDIIRNIRKMYAQGDGHVHVLAASLRNLNHLEGAFAAGAELVTAPAKLLEEWGLTGNSQADTAPAKEGTTDHKELNAIPYQEVDLNAPWETYDLRHELTTKGIERFVADYRSTLLKAA